MTLSLLCGYAAEDRNIGAGQPEDGRTECESVWTDEHAGFALWTLRAAWTLRTGWSLWPLDTGFTNWTHRTTRPLWTHRTGWTYWTLFSLWSCRTLFPRLTGSAWRT